jgi:phosphatidate cytidylyltransferase
MPLNVPTFYKRLGSSIVFVAIMLSGLLWNGRAFLLLVCLINVLCLREYFRLFQKISPETYWPDWLPTVMQIISLMMILRCYSLEFNESLSKVLWVVSSLFPAVFLLLGVMSKKLSLFAILQAVGGLFYITLPMMMLILMSIQQFRLPLVLILMIWSNDTMAYLVGSFFGKTQFSAISPKKTWEGTIGGAVITVIAAAVVGHFIHAFRMVDWIMLALCATVAGTAGDLLESKLKRMADVKDAGNLMPGHGGALDRFDSLLIATPFAFVYVIYFMH